MNITLPVVSKEGFESVPAKLLFELAPHLASVATFALHKCMPGDPLYSGRWFVSNVETGRWVAYHRVKARALREAVETLSKKSLGDMHKSYSECGEDDAPHSATHDESSKE